MDKKIICWFSCGITSAVACWLTIQEYGIENCVVVYIEIKSAHEDNERFIMDCEKWYGCEIIKISSDKANDQFEVIEKARYINGVFGAPCTKVLKKDVRTKYTDEHPFLYQVFGFEFDKHEINRAVRFKQQYPDTIPLFPLIKKRLTKNICAYILKKAGIAIPIMYQLGFNNNNCIGCVKGGMGYWNKIKKYFRSFFNSMSNLEQTIGASCINGKFLKDLKQNDGRNEPDVMPDCGLFCQIEFADILDPLTNKILQGETTLI